MVTAEAPLICVIDDDPSIREALMGLLSAGRICESKRSRRQRPS